MRDAFTRVRTRLSPMRARTRSIKAECEISSKQAFDVAFSDPLVGVGGEMTHLGHRVVCPAPRTEAVTARLEVRLEDRLQY